MLRMLSSRCIAFVSFVSCLCLPPTRTRKREEIFVWLRPRNRVVFESVDYNKILDAASFVLLARSTISHQRSIHDAGSLPNDTQQERRHQPCSSAMTPRSQPCKDGQDKHDVAAAVDSKYTPESPFEQTCFTCHFLLIPLAISYVLWSVLSEDDLESWGIEYYPRKQWSVYLPVSMVCIFTAVPIIYGMLNSFAVPKLDSIDGLMDDHSNHVANNGNSSGNHPDSNQTGRMSEGQATTQQDEWPPTMTSIVMDR